MIFKIYKYQNLAQIKYLAKIQELKIIFFENFRIFKKKIKFRKKKFK